ncbi:MAG: RluA family pseudouridine synthase [Eubacteriales bacterium]
MKENYYTYHYMILEDLDKITMKDYLRKYYGYSSRLIRQVKREGCITLNGKEESLMVYVKKNDNLSVQLAIEKLDVEPEHIPLDIIHEDDDVLIINKQWGIVTHPTLSHPKGNLANAIAWHWLHKGVSAKVRFVNRLDRDTSGIVIIAKNKYAHHFIQNEMMKDRVEKTYYAVVEGIPLVEKGRVDFPIGRISEDSIMREEMIDGQYAVTYYQVMEKYRDNAFLQINIETGRTHQIRVHLRGIGHPIVGDSLYNEKQSELMQRQALHAKGIVFYHPRSHKRVTFQAQLPRDMVSLIDELHKGL